MSMEVANTILEQLGGRRFRVMTGAKDFVGGENSLMFRLPSTPHFVKDGINKVRITLEPSDTYKIEFFKIRGVKFKTVAETRDIYFDQLQEVFTRHTGLTTRLF